MLARRIAVDGSPVVVSHDRIAVGLEQLALDGTADRTPPICRAKAEQTAAERAVFAGCLDALRHDRAGDHLAHPAERVVSIQGRPAARNHLELLDAKTRDRAPVDPTAEGIVRRDPVHQNEAARDAGRPDPAQGHALRAGIGGETARAAKEPQGRNDGEQLVQGLRRASLELDPRHHDHCGRDVADGTGAAGCGYDDLLAVSGLLRLVRGDRRRRRRFLRKRAAWRNTEHRCQTCCRKQSSRDGHAPSRMG